MCELKSMLSEVLECVSGRVEHSDRIGSYNYVTPLAIIRFLTTQETWCNSCIKLGLSETHMIHFFNEFSPDASKTHLNKVCCADRSAYDNKVPRE